MLRITYTTFRGRTVSIVDEYKMLPKILRDIERAKGRNVRYTSLPPVVAGD